MRIEPYTEGSIVHVIKRGARGMEIVRDAHDRERFLDSLLFLNDEFRNENWLRDISELPRFTRPAHWPERKPLVDIIAWTLLDNHVHLLISIRGANDRGLTEFLQRLFRSMTGNFNAKYGGRGSIFQGPYRSVTIDSDSQLRYVIPYILVKNTFEMHPEGFAKAVRKFESSWEWATHYRYSSLESYTTGEFSPILTRPNIINEIFPTSRALKIASKDMLLAYHARRDDLPRIEGEN